MQNSKLQFKIQNAAIFLVVCCLLFVAYSVFAAETIFETKNSQIQVGDTLEVGFFLNTENEDINAVEGKIVFPEKLLELKEIKDGNSIINFWIERPKTKNGEIPFSGIIPGGYLGNKGLIFSVVFQSTQEGRGSIEIGNIQVLLNDGKGTEANITISNLQFVISKQAPASQPAVVERKDTDLPEVFKPIVTSDPAVFGGKYFLVFATQDKGSGIDHYEVREGKGSFILAESPYLLQNQNLDKEIAVKAVDKSGNERVITLPPQRSLPWYQNYWVWAIIMLGIVVIYVIWRIKLKMKSEK